MAGRRGRSWGPVLNWTPDHPLDLARWGDRFVRWGPDPCTVMVDGAVHREVDGTLWRATQAGTSVHLDVTGDRVVAFDDLRARVGEGLPWAPVVALAERDPRVEALVSRHPGYRPPITPDPWEALVGAISAQQVNLRWALTTRTRLVEAFGATRDIHGVVVWQFPAPASVAAADPDDLRAMQFTSAKATAIVDAARHATDGHLDGLDALGNEAAVAHLTSMRGVGRWTAEQVLARSLARPDAVAAGDLGVRKAISFLWHGADHLLDETTVRDTADTWGDAANWVVHLLLEDLARQPRAARRGG